MRCGDTTHFGNASPYKPLLNPGFVVDVLVLESPLLAESKWRIAIGLTVVLEPGPCRTQRYQRNGTDLPLDMSWFLFLAITVVNSGVSDHERSYGIRILFILGSEPRCT